MLRVLWNKQTANTHTGWEGWAGNCVDMKRNFLYLDSWEQRAQEKKKYWRILVITLKDPYFFKFW